MNPQPHKSPAQRRADKETADFIVKLVRDLALLLAGVGLTVYEGITGGTERPSLYVLYAGMMGLGPVLRYAESRKEQG